MINLPYKGFPIHNPITGEVVHITYRPMLLVRISYGHHLSWEFEALVDSGSDRNLFPAYLGEIIGINFKKVKPLFINGIGGSQVEAFPVLIKLFIGAKSYETTIDFSYEQKIPLLGRKGFFNLFKSIKFDEKGKFFYIEE